MPITEHALRSLLETHFPEASIALEDMAGDDDHWSATIISPVFAGKTRIEQHRMVQNAVNGWDIHALAIKTLTPET